jgi:WD40 repeat protein
MSRDDIASCAEEKFDFNISYALIDSNQNQIYIVPFNTKSILVWKIVDTTPSIMKLKEIIDEEENDVYIYGLALSPDESCLVTIMSDQSIALYQNKDNLRFISKVRSTFCFVCF